MSRKVKRTLKKRGPKGLVHAEVMKMMVALGFKEGKKSQQDLGIYAKVAEHFGVTRQNIHLMVKAREAHGFCKACQRPWKVFRY